LSRADVIPFLALEQVKYCSVTLPCGLLIPVRVGL